MIEESPLVSIIVPIYNVGQYIEKCIKSIMNQDCENIEIILVNDGSTDDSGAIVDRIAQTDSRVIVIHKSNGGVSSARNSGLDAAKGEYVLFVDGDDYVEPDYVSYFVRLVSQNGCDVAMSRNNYSEDVMNQVEEDSIMLLDSETVIEQIYLGKIFVAVWNKIYRRTFLNQNNLRFNPEIWYGEGMLFNIECLQYTDTVALGEKRVYHQVFNPNSAMRNFNLESNYCGIRSMEIQRALWKKKNDRIERAWKYHYRCFAYSIFSGLVRTGMDAEHKDECCKCKKALREDIMLPIIVDIPIKLKLLYIACAIAPEFVARRAAWKFKRKIARLESERLNDTNGTKQKS